MGPLDPPLHAIHILVDLHGSDGTRIVIFSIVRDVMEESIFLFVPNIIGTCMTDATL